MIKPIKSILQLGGITLGLSLVTVSSHATIVGQLWQGTPEATAASQNATLSQAAGLGTPTAKFNPTAIDFNSNVTGYSLNQFLNSPTFYDTAAGFDPNGSSDWAYYLFTGELFLNAGNNSFVIPHDDGLQLNIDGFGLVVDQPGPTSAVNTPFNVNAPTSGLYTFQMSYGECCGAPGVLGFAINGAPVGNAPDYGSTLGLLSAGLAGLGFLRRKLA